MQREDIGFDRMAGATGGRGPEQHVNALPLPFHLTTEGQVEQCSKVAGGNGSLSEPSPGPSRQDDARKLTAIRLDREFECGTARSLEWLGGRFTCDPPFEICVVSAGSVSVRDWNVPRPVMIERRQLWPAGDARVGETVPFSRPSHFVRDRVAFFAVRVRPAGAAFSRGDRRIDTIPVP